MRARCRRFRLPQLLQLKVNKLEQLVKLKDNKINALTTKLETLTMGS